MTVSECCLIYKSQYWKWLAQGTGSVPIVSALHCRAVWHVLTTRTTQVACRCASTTNRPPLPPTISAPCPLLVTRPAEGRRLSWRARMHDATDGIIAGARSSGSGCSHGPGCRRSRPGSLQAGSDSSPVSERPRTTVSVLEHCIPVSSADTRRHLPSANRHLLAVPRFSLNTYGRRAFSVAGPMTWNSLPDFIHGIQRAAQTVLGVYLKRLVRAILS